MSSNSRLESAIDRIRGSRVFTKHFLKDLTDADPTNKLTREEKLYCIRNLPIEIVNKLFPTL